MRTIKKMNRLALGFFIYYLSFGFVMGLLSSIPFFQAFLFRFVYGLSVLELSMVLSVCVFGIPIVLYFLITKESIKDTLKLNRMSGRNLLLACLLAYLIQPSMSLLAQVSNLYFPNVVEESFQILEEESMITMLIAMAVMPAFMEEFLIRGICLTGYEKLGKKKAIFCTALLFGLMHMNPQQASYAILGGIGFGFLVQRMGSIWAGIVPHFLINGGSVMASFLPIEREEDLMISSISDIELIFYTLQLTIFSLPLLGGVVYLVCKNNPYEKEEELTLFEIEKQEKIKFLTWEIYVVFLLFFLFGLLPYLVSFELFELLGIG